MGICCGSPPSVATVYSFMIGRNVFSCAERKTMREPSGVQPTAWMPAPMNVTRFGDPPVTGIT